MKPFCRLAAIIAFTVTLFSPGARAQSQYAPQSASSSAGLDLQSDASPPAEVHHRNEFGVWGGFSFSNANLIGVTDDVQLYEAAFRYGRVITDKPFWSFEWTVDVFPAEIVRQRTVTDVIYQGQRPVSYTFTSQHQVVYGGGINPVSLKFNFVRQSRVQPFFTSTAGFVTSVKPVPVPVTGEEQFNFDFDFGGGVQVFDSSRTRAWMVGYKYKHISNAYRGEINPGVDLNVIFVGYSFLK
jgi:Lipid A 3-O-deacylase (PagL)